MLAQKSVPTKPMQTPPELSGIGRLIYTSLVKFRVAMAQGFVRE
jgi:hypothetical protein